MKDGRFILLAFLLLTVCPIMVPTTARAASAIIYLSADYDGTGAAPFITNTADFAPICNGTGGSPRLPGLNLARAFAGGQLCPGTTESNRFTTEPIFVLLIDDTSALSAYLIDYLQTQNSLQQVSGRRVVAPGIRTFQVAGQSISVLMVGEMAYRQGGSNAVGWFTTLNTLPSAAFVAQPPRILSAYMTECSNATNDVPLPPDWRNDRAQNTALGWQFQGILPTNLVLASTEPVTEVWTYTNSKGVCKALPRKNAGGDIKLLGIICQSKQTGKSCFWDNVRNTGPNAGNRREGAATDNMKISEIQGGDELNENCTQCHRGNNVFLVPNAGNPLGAGIYPDRPSRYAPIPTGRMSGASVGPPPEVDTLWENPPASIPKNTRGESCSSCHEIPALTKKYCETLLKGVFDQDLMPPGGGWRSDPSIGGTLITACRTKGVNITPAP